MGHYLLLLADAGFLNDTARDWLTVVSLLLTVVGLGYTAFQTHRAATAARAARDAAEGARRESLQRFRAFTAHRLQGYANRAKDHLDRQEWRLAGQRLHDLADEAGYLVQENPEWAESATLLRQAADRCADLAAGRRKQAQPQKWATLLNDVLARLHSYQTPV